jgi:hypothetical protein
VVFVPAGVGGLAFAILRSKWGLLLNVPVVMTETLQRLLGVPDFMNPRIQLPNGAMAAAMATAALLCVAVLNARIRGREVVRG